jgi:hypothetical protein
MRTINRTFLGCLFAAIAGGCSTYVTNTEGTDFNRSVRIVADHLKDSLAEVQSLEVMNAVDAYAKGSERTLEHLAIDPKLSESTVKMIDGQFDFLVCYSDALKNATSPGTAWSTSVSSLNSAESKLMGDAQGLDNKFTGKTPITDTNVQTFNADAGKVAKVVASIGEAALALYGEEKASKIAASVDPDFQKYCSDLEALLTYDPDAKTPRTGLASILVADYEERVATVKYLATTALPASGPDDPNYFALVQQRGSILNEYMALREREKVGLAKILALRKAVVEIASAHEALAKKDDVTFKEKISNSEELVRSITRSGKTPDDASSK